MVIRRIREHVAAQNWFAVGVDLAIVVVGVFLGTQANNWNQERIERGAARSYRAEIIENLRANEISIDDQTAYYRRVLGHALAALDALERPGSAMDQAFLVHAYQATQVRQRQLTQSAYEEMKSAGLSRNVAEPETRARLSAFYAQMPQINAATLTVTAYRDRLRRAMPITIQRQLRERCGDIIRTLPGGVTGSILPERCVLRLDSESVARAAARIRATSDLNLDLTRHIADIDQKLRQLQGFQRQARELRMQLESRDKG
ncbi:MAG TPA: hypothetical protein VNA29_07700 [Sphingomicrobium sp.]|nr:hypothetical protein [Sphingomicrobium sp.]